MSTKSVLLILLLCGILLDSYLGAPDGMKEDFVSERECPFLCACIGYDVNCSDTNLFPDAIPQETERVVIMNSTLDFVPINAFLSLTNLQEIHFIGCKITKLRACSFAELENMVTISFENTKIEQIEGNAFSNLANISNIRFTSSSIGEMFSFSFHNVQNIQRLEFFDTAISTIHPYAMLTFKNIDEIGIMDCTIHKFLRDGFSRFTNVYLMYMTSSSIQEWQCGSFDTIVKAGIDFTVSRSNLICDCKLAWLWTRHPNSTILNRTNKCSGTDDTLTSVDINQVCPLEKSRDKGCPPLLPSTPHTCSRSFDSPMNPVEKVTYPDFFSRTTVSSSAPVRASWSLMISAIMITLVDLLPQHFRLI